MSPPSHKRRRLGAPLLSLPDEILCTILNSLAPKSAFSLSLTCTHLRRLFRSSFTTLDLSTPFATRTTHTPADLHAFLRHTVGLTTLRLPTCLPPRLPRLPLRALAVTDSPPLRALTALATLRELRIRAPLPTTAPALLAVLPQLSALHLTAIPVAALPGVERLLRAPHALCQLTVAVADGSAAAVGALAAILPAVRTATLSSLCVGVATPAQVSRSRGDADVRATLSALRALLPRRAGAGPRLHLYAPGFHPLLVRAALAAVPEPAALRLAFAANAIETTPAGPVLAELAAHRDMCRLPDAFPTDLTAFNIVVRSLAISYTPARRPGLRQIITPRCHTLRVHIPFRSTTHLPAIERLIRDVMTLAAVTSLHITREVVYLPVSLAAWAPVKRLYLTAPENFPEDPYPERRCTKLSAWRLVVALPGFLGRLATASPKLESVLLEEVGEMGEVQNGEAMRRLIDVALHAVDRFERRGVDAGSVVAQLLAWRRQFL